jgi:hypothetical protein
MNKKEQLKLIYVLKVGTNAKDEGIYEFIFSKSPDNINEKDWAWDIFPAKDNARPPDMTDIDEVYVFKTDLFILKCLHDQNDRCYLDGYYKIHAIAYEDYEFKNTYGIEYNDVLVFHYGMSLEDVEAKLYKRDIILDEKRCEFIQARNMSLKKRKNETQDSIF